MVSVEGYRLLVESVPHYQIEQSNKAMLQAMTAQAANRVVTYEDGTKPVVKAKAGGVFVL